MIRYTFLNNMVVSLSPSSIKQTSVNFYSFIVDKYAQKLIMLSYIKEYDYS